VVSLYWEGKNKKMRRVRMARTGLHEDPPMTFAEKRRFVRLLRLLEKTEMDEVIKHRYSPKETARQIESLEEDIRQNFFEVYLTNQLLGYFNEGPHSLPVIIDTLYVIAECRKVSEKVYYQMESKLIDWGVLKLSERILLSREPVSKSGRVYGLYLLEHILEGILFSYSIEGLYEEIVRWESVYEDC
jgi:hypothetical protein